MAKLLKLLAALVLCPLVAIALYLLAALVGGALPASLNRVADRDRLLDPPVLLFANALHADIAIPVNSLTLHKFEFLREAGLPLDNPALKYLVIGWGSKAFYTSTRDYGDMEFATVWRAATGDQSVMHVAPAGNLKAVDGVIKLEMSEDGFAQMVEFLRAFFESSNGKPVIVEGATFGYGDVFYESDRHFHLFYPCNEWVAEALRAAGLASGVWTPTTYSLLLNHYLYN